MNNTPISCQYYRHIPWAKARWSSFNAPENGPSNRLFKGKISFQRITYGTTFIGKLLKKF